MNSINCAPNVGITVTTTALTTSITTTITTTPDNNNILGRCYKAEARESNEILIISDSKLL